jgi:hypothetical protein
MNLLSKLEKCFRNWSASHEHDREPLSAEGRFHAFRLEERVMFSAAPMDSGVSPDIDLDMVQAEQTSLVEQNSISLLLPDQAASEQIDDPSDFQSDEATSAQASSLDSEAPQLETAVDDFEVTPTANSPLELSDVAAQFTPQDSNVVFKPTNDNAIQLTDPDSNSPSVSATLEVDNGRLTLENRNGLSFTTGDGIQDSVADFSGTFASVQNALTSITYDPDASFVGIDEFTVQVTDPADTADRVSELISIDVRAIGPFDEEGSELVNATTTDTQEAFSASRGSRSAVAAAPDGNYVVVWSSTDQANGRDVYAQFFTPDGSKVGSEILVNQTLVGDQDSAVVGIDYNGDVVVA